MKTKSKTAELTGRYAKLYSVCLKEIISLMKSNGLLWLYLTYDILEKRCYNVNDYNGDTDIFQITSIRLDPEKNTLFVLDYSGNEFCIGNDIDGQDNYTICGIDTLLLKVEEAVETFKKKLLVFNSAMDKKTLIKTISSFIGKEGCLSFEHGFKYPSIKNNSYEVTQVTDKGLVLNVTTRDSKPFENIPKRDLLTVCRSINDYFRYIQNTV